LSLEGIKNSTVPLEKEYRRGKGMSYDMKCSLRKKGDQSREKKEKANPFFLQLEKGKKRPYIPKKRRSKGEEKKEEKLRLIGGWTWRRSSLSETWFPRGSGEKKMEKEATIKKKLLPR